MPVSFIINQTPCVVVIMNVVNSAERTSVEHLLATTEREALKKSSTTTAPFNCFSNLLLCLLARLLVTIVGNNNKK